MEGLCQASCERKNWQMKKVLCTNNSSAFRIRAYYSMKSTWEFLWQSSRASLFVIHVPPRNKSWSRATRTAGFNADNKPPSSEDSRKNVSLFAFFKNINAVLRRIEYPFLFVTPRNEPWNRIMSQEYVIAAGTSANFQRHGPFTRYNCAPVQRHPANVSVFSNPL